MKKTLNTILKKMCEKVGADYDKMDFKKEDWFLEYEWTEEREAEFKDWLKTYLKENKKARTSLMRWPTKRNRNIEKVVKEFLFNYGWKTAE